jgi:hypothetical protein
MVEIRWVVLKLNLSQVTDIAEEIQEPMADQVITTEPELILCFSWVLFIFNKFSEYMASLCINETVGLWGVDCEQSLW